MTTLAYLGLSWLAGLVLAHWLAPPLAGLPFAALPALGGMVLYRQRRPARLAGACWLALLLGAARMLSAAPHLDANHVAAYNDRGTVRVTGLVAAAPDVRATYANLRLAAEQLTFRGQTVEVEGLVLVRAPRYPAYRYGDRLAVTARLETPPEFEDFSYKDYLARQGIYAMMRRPRIERLGGGHGSPFWASLYALRDRGQLVINRSLPEPFASLLTGILLGVESGIPAELYDKFNATGTSHIIVISGSNITLISGLLIAAGRRLVGIRWAAMLAILGIGLYTLLVGADAAVSRAALMGILWVIALWVGRPGMALNALVASGLIMTAANPFNLWDAGFQLSFMATLGLILFVPSLEAWASGRLEQRLDGPGARVALDLLKEAVLVTLAATVLTTPIILYHFGRFSLISLLANLLILPAQPLVMICGGLTTGAGLIFLPLGQALAWLAWLPLAWTVWVVERLAGVPYASIEVARLPFGAVAGSYALIALGFWWRKSARAARPVANEG